ncbi:hypothetical protein D7207_07330 [Burkholderia cepacia]|nr:hypothetical protein WL94_37405 [Burkholderia cepacia]MBA9897782.1 hypothetical protein [Burkholderia cepacia]MBA9944472.1 hypothetical protein [Burkholderia cepacia]MBA9974939.1 hypothetical protein [Burkholderia cepacia]MBA9992988.1 hypothetical protein [Burkholderia cepacia]
MQTLRFFNFRHNIFVGTEDFEQIVKVDHVKRHAFSFAPKFLRKLGSDVEMRVFTAVPPVRLFFTRNENDVLTQCFSQMQNGFPNCKIPNPLIRLPLIFESGRLTARISLPQFMCQLIARIRNVDYDFRCKTFRI